MIGLQGQVALVAGAARGIGRSIAVLLAEHGADVVVADVDFGAEATDGAEHAGVQAEIEALGRTAVRFEGDLSERAVARGAVQAAISRFGRLDVLVIAAGGAITPPETSTAATSSSKDRTTLFDANFTALVNCCQEAAPHLRAAGAGSIITIVSQAGTYVQPSGRLAFYGASKAAAISYTRSLAAELGPHGVRVNAVAPGLTLTPRVAEKLKQSSIAGGPEDRVRDVALRRLGTPRDIAKVALFLASDLGAWVTGQCIAADGGQVPLGPH